MTLPHADLSGKTIVITGATQGIGLATAHGLALLKPRLILVSRDKTRCEAAVQEVKERSGNPQISYLQADLSSQSSIRQLARDVLAQTDRLDVLVNNAGAIFEKRAVSVDGYELTFALNHLNYFLLTGLLLPRLKQSGPARIVNVASRAHVRASFNLSDLQSEKSYTPMTVYGNSKLANLLFTYELARRLEGTNVTVNALHPGVVSTGFARNNSGIWSAIFTLASPFLLTPEKGAQTSIYLASSPEVAGVSGKYFDKCKPVRSTPVSYDVQTARQLWEASEKLTGFTYP